VGSALAEGTLTGVPQVPVGAAATSASTSGFDAGVDSDRNRRYALAVRTPIGVPERASSRGAESATKRRVDGLLRVGDQLDPVAAWIMAVDARPPSLGAEALDRARSERDPVVLEQFDALGRRALRPEGQIGTAQLVERRGAARIGATGPGAMDVDLLSAESVCPRTQRIARTFGIVDALESEDVDVERMRGVPVVDVDDHVIEIADAHASSLPSSDARLPERPDGDVGPWA
jgi:hypothetical protein